MSGHGPGQLQERVHRRHHTHGDTWVVRPPGQCPRSSRMYRGRGRECGDELVCGGFIPDPAKPKRRLRRDPPMASEWLFFQAPAFPSLKTPDNLQLCGRVNKEASLPHPSPFRVPCIYGEDRAPGQLQNRNPRDLTGISRMRSPFASGKNYRDRSFFLIFPGMISRPFLSI